MISMVFLYFCLTFPGIRDTIEKMSVQEEPFHVVF